VGATSAEVVLDGPDGVEAHAVGQLDLFEGLAVGALLAFALPIGMGTLVPGLRGVHFVEKIELHGAS